MGYVSRAMGAVLGDYLSANAAAAVFLGLLLLICVFNVVLHKQLVQ